MLVAPVTVGLYATATGTWLPYEPAVLAKAWENLRQHPDAIAHALSEG